MPQYIVLRIYPDQPVNGASFTTYLTGLSIDVFNRSYNNPGGVLLGSTFYDPMSSAANIVEHSWQETGGAQTTHSSSVATAVIEVPANPDFAALDFKVVDNRNGQQVWAYDWSHTQTTLTASTAPPSTSYATLPVVTAYLVIPAPGQQLASPGAHIELAADGGPPSFDVLQQAIALAVAQDPNATPNLAALTPAQCLVLADRITWDHALYIMPLLTFTPAVDLDVMYTLDYVYPPAGAQQRNAADAQAAILLFTAARTAQQNNAATRLSQYIFAYSAALACETASKTATAALIQIPTHTATHPEPGKIAAVDIGIAFTPAPQLSFGVPAAYFYALTVELPTSQAPPARYQHVVSDDPQTNFDSLDGALQSGMINATDGSFIPPGGTASEAVTPAQAVNRLLALGGQMGPLVVAVNTPATTSLVRAWLAFNTSQDIADFWSAAVANPGGSELAGQLEIMLLVVTENRPTLAQTILSIPVSTVEQLAEFTVTDWLAFFIGTPASHPVMAAFVTASGVGVNRVTMLSPNLMPGAADHERVMAFVGVLRQFYAVTQVATQPPGPSPVPVPLLPVSANDPFEQFSATYEALAHTPYTYSTGLNAQAQAAISAVAQQDACILEWLTKAVGTLQDLSEVVGTAPDQELRFSIIEALYARGFTSKAAIAKLSLDEFNTALTGSVAFAYAEQILLSAGGTAQGPQPVQEPFRPINPDGLLTNCIPPAELSPLGPVAYLHEMLRVSAASTCAAPTPDADPANPALDLLLTPRRGPLGTLSVTPSNLETPIPVIDIVNECLEAMVAASGADGVVPPAGAHGVVYDTALTSLAGHKLQLPGAPATDDPELHDPAVMLGALAEHSSPATPVAAPVAYAKLRQDFSAPNLPYTRAFDLNRSYLAHLGTSRFEALRCFQKDIREFLHDPAQEPAGFERYLRRKPYRAALFCEYLGISPEEYATLFTSATIPPGNLYGYSSTTPASTWVQAVGDVPEFLKRTGLSYCELMELQDALGERFRIRSIVRGQEAPPCEPCCLQDYYLEIVGGASAEAFRILAIFIRLWRKLQTLCGDGYSFAELRDICDVLGLYDATTGAVNPDFIRQLAAFQMLRDDLHLPLADRDDEGAPPNPIDEERTHLLALWRGPAARKYDWAVGTLLHRLQGYAEHHHGCDRRHPEFIKLLRGNLDRLALLSGVAPWDKKPTHTLRFAEVLGKIYASEFSVGEILFIFTNEPHLTGDDPFALATVQETHDSPLQLPDDDEHFSLLALRRKLLAVESSDADVEAWTWTRIEASLQQEFGYAPPSSGPDPLTALGRHFFPSTLRREGRAVPAGSTQYRVPLANQSAPMWNTPLEGPFRYDAGSGELWSQLPLKDGAVLAKLSRQRQLSAPERDAVRDLYFSPHVELARFAFIFANFAEAERKLIQDEDEDARWAFFQREFARCHERCSVIARHLAEHGARVRGHDEEHHEEKHRGGIALAWKVLRHLLADENKASSTWEDDSGHAPPVTWPQPGGGAFAALLGLAGTGLVSEFRVAGGNQVVWRELRGGMDAFSPVRNDWNAPVPTVIPAMDLTISQEVELFTSVRNGFGFGNASAERLGGLQAFSVTWKGSLLIECEGCYQFWAGGPSETGEFPTPAGDHGRWRLRLKRGQKEWVFLSHRWEGDEGDAFCSEPVSLQRGVYRLEIEFKQPQPEFSRHEDVCAQRTGFQVKYKGPDTSECIAALPFDRLFQERKNQQLSGSLKLAGQALVFLESLHTGSLREIRNTYQRALKAFVFADRFDLSAKGISDDGQSEIGYMLDHPARFAGTAYSLVGSNYQPHLADFDFNLLPVGDIYNPDFDYTPSATFLDERNLTESSVPAASLMRPEALFATWERIFDYGVLRRLARRAPQRTAWLLFHEAAENHPNDPDQLLWHIDVDVSHHQAVLNYFGPFAVATTDLEDERWAVRIARANQFIEGVKAHFLTKDIRDAKPDLWAANDPDDPATPGNSNLTKFVQDGSFENGEPGRYEHIKLLDDGLRERGREALTAFLCAMNRVTRPDGSPVTEAKHISETLLVDVEVGLCEEASRIEEAITAIQLYVQRARLGLEPTLKPGSEFLLVWDRHFQTFRTWEACKRRDVYRENWIEFDELEQARRSEAFRFLEDRLRGAGLTSPAPGGAIHWPPKALPGHDGVALIQKAEPSLLQELQPKREGFGLLGMPERQPRQSWLARLEDRAGRGGASTAQADRGCAPLWIETANRLGTRFVRVAAAGAPPASLDICAPGGHTGCCAECGKVHEPHIDEYYFWLVDARHFTETAATELYQDPLWKWHDPELLPGLLEWSSKPMVHLMWCRVHNGEVQQMRRSSEGVRVGVPPPDLDFKGRSGDSFRFEVTGGEKPAGYPSLPAAGFRYDLATDSAVVLPQLASASPPPGLAHPFFLYFVPGASLYPPSCFSPSLAIGDHLRAHCRFEEALRWYEHAYAPLQRDNYWLKSRKLGKPQSPLPVTHCSDGTDVADAAVFSERAIILRYIETLVQWADSLMCRNSPEAFQQARLILDTATRILGDMPRTIAEHADAPKPPMAVAGFMPHFAPLNPRLVAAYETVRDRLSLIHSCLNRRRLRSGMPNVDVPYWGNSALRDGWKTTVNVCEDDGCCAPCRPYRFSVLVKQAQDLANEVKGFGSALLSAYEKGDGEYLASLREVHANQLQALNLSIRQNQWRDADWQVQALRKTKEATQLRRTYNNNLFIAGLIMLESRHRTRSIKAMNWRLASNATEVASSLLRIIPDIYSGQNNFAHLPVGSKLADLGSAVARGFGAVSDYWGAKASLDLTDAGWLRRAVEWNFQVQVLDIELQQIEDQILGAERRRDVSLRELNNHQRQMEQSQETLDFLRDKFTNGALYGWMQKETAALHRRAYELALHAAYAAQRAFNNECGHVTRSFVPQDIWDNLHEGLLAGDRLQLALKQMEKAYYDENCREYELSKHVSLRQHAPFAFLQLKATGSCEVELPDWLFDHDYPGQYMRRIRSVSLTLPCVVGPYVGVHCRLTLLSSATRIDPRLSDEGAACCTDEPGCDAGYLAKADDARIVRQYSAVEAIATSNGQNDSGLFELNFRDERYLPFELAGAVSRWRIELPPETNYFDLDSLSEVVIHLNYTAREGGTGLRDAARCEAEKHLPGDGWLLLDARHDFPMAWHAFSDAADCDCRYLEVRLSRRMFPFVPGSPSLQIGDIHVFYETDCAVASRHQCIELLDAESAKHCPPRHGCKPETIECVASEEWPRLFHGVIAGRELRLDPDRDIHFGSLRFPPNVPCVRRVYVVVHYERCEAVRPACGNARAERFTKPKSIFAKHTGKHYSRGSLP
jgi:hypothetical protein